MDKKSINRIGFITTGITFLIGTIIILCHYLGIQGEWEFYGFMFIPIAVVANFLMIIIISYVAHRNSVIGPFKSIYSMFLNIPVAIIYFCLAFYLAGIFRITIINDTSNTVSNIKLSGCEEKTKDNLKPGEKKTFWVGINGDCYIDISYLDKNDSIQQDEVISYLSGAMGGQDSYHISGENNPRY